MQKLKLTGGAYQLEGYLEYGACNDENCLPPTQVPFQFSGKVEMCIRDSSVTVSDIGGRTLSGQTLDTFLASVQHADIFSVGLNCSFGARQLDVYKRQGLWKLSFLKVVL